MGAVYKSSPSVKPHTAKAGTTVQVRFTVPAEWRGRVTSALVRKRLAEYAAGRLRLAPDPGPGPSAAKVRVSRDLVKRLADRAGRKSLSGFLRGLLAYALPTPHRKRPEGAVERAVAGPGSRQDRSEPSSGYPTLAKLPAGGFGGPFRALAGAVGAVQRARAPGAVQRAGTGAGTEPVRAGSAGARSAGAGAEAGAVFPAYCLQCRGFTPHQGGCVRPVCVPCRDAGRAL